MNGLELWGLLGLLGGSSNPSEFTQVVVRLGFILVFYLHFQPVAPSLVIEQNPDSHVLTLYKLL